MVRRVPYTLNRGLSRVDPRKAAKLGGEEYADEGVG
jgi:hypothetical protein